jgi:hypothetical protein
MLCGFYFSKKTSNFGFDIIKLIQKLLGGGWNLVLPISKPFNYNYNTFLQIKKSLNLIQKLVLVP